MKSTQVFTKRKLNQSIMQFAIITLLIMGVGGYYGYTNYSEYQATQTAKELENAKLAELKSAALKTKQDYLVLKKDLDAQNVTVNQAIEKILPSNEDFTNLARDLDKYFWDTKGTANPMFLSNLTFSVPLANQEEELAKLPLNISVTGDETGLKTFLKYVENSGDLNDKTRLLDMSNLSINFSRVVPTTEGETTNTETTNPNYGLPVQETITSTMSLNAFYQKPLTLATP